MRTKVLFLVIVFVLLVGSSFGCTKKSKRGHLLIIGGEAEPPKAIKKFIALANNGPILVITSAGEIRHKYGEQTIETFKANGAKHVEMIHIADANEANAENTVKKIKSFKGIFFTGGVQVLLMQRIGDTKTHEAIKDFYLNRGGIIGGTSAGASCQSKVMITGVGNYTIMEKNNIETSTGFGFLENIIIDQHFLARSRSPRLFVPVIETGLIGIGIDEKTAIIYNPDDTFEVFGVSSVMVYDPRGCYIANCPDSKKLSIENLKVSILHAGQIFDMKKGKIKKD